MILGLAVPGFQAVRGGRARPRVDQRIGRGLGLGPAAAATHGPGEFELNLGGHLGALRRAAAADGRGLPLLLLRLGFKRQPEQVQHAVVDDWQNLFTGDVHIDRLPGRPQRGVEVIRPVVVLVRDAAGATDDMQHIDRRSVLRVPVELMMDPDHCEIGHGIELVQICAQGILAPLRRDLAGQDLLLQIPEEGGLVVAQFGCDPVLGVQEDLAVGLPQAVALHPLPLPPRVGRRSVRAFHRVDHDLWLLQVQEGPLHEHLRAGDGLLEPGGQGAGGGLHVDQEVAQQVLG